MSQAVLEIVYIPLVPGFDLTTGENKTLVDETLGTITSQSGCKSLYYGRQVEHPDILEMAIEWESLKHHKDFMESPIYGPFVEKLKPALSGNLSMHHIELQTKSLFNFTEAVSAPVTERITQYFDLSHSNEAFDNNFIKFAEAGLEHAKEARGLSGGWSIEEHKHANFGAKDGEEGPAKGFNVFVGWPSVEAHLEFRKSEVFPEVVKYIRDGPKAVDVHHTAFQKS